MGARISRRFSSVAIELHRELLLQKNLICDLCCVTVKCWWLDETWLKRKKRGERPRRHRAITATTARSRVVTISAKRWLEYMYPVDQGMLLSIGASSGYFGNRRREETPTRYFCSMWDYYFQLRSPLEVVWPWLFYFFLYFRVHQSQKLSSTMQKCNS